MNFSGFNFSRTGFGLLALLALAICGCQTYSGPPEKNLALVTINNRSLAVVQAAVTNVFCAHGFTGNRTGDNGFNFTRPAGSLDKMIYGSVVFTDTVTRKVTVTTQTAADGSIAVSCRAWLDAGEEDPVFEGDHQLTPLRKGPYEKLLKEVQRQLGE
ncbi:MAG TPA: hypothetical protein VIK62_07290 [Verrucomicrobiae bacterium]